MFLPHHRANAKWAPNTLTSENITGNGQTFPVLSAGSSVDDQGRVNISLANVDLVNTRTIKVTINSSKSAYAVSTAQVITGPAKDSYNDYAADGEGEHPGARRFQLLDLREDAAGHAAGEERRDAGPDAHAVGDRVRLPRTRLLVERARGIQVRAGVHERRAARRRIGGLRVDDGGRTGARERGASWGAR